MTDIATVLTSSNTTMASPAAPEAQASLSTGIPVDFLQLLTAHQMTAPTATPIAQIAASEEPIEEGETLPDGLAALPLAIPFMTLEPKVIAAGVNPALNSLSMTARSGSTASTLTTSSLSVSGELQLVTEMIEAEMALTKDGQNLPDSFQLPNTQLDSVNKQPAHHDAISRPVQAPVGSSQWADEIGTRLTMMTEQGKHAASLRMSPEHLGPLEIRISVRDDQASVWFGAAHADTRAAIEHALPRLRELFESQGLSLADAGVYHEAPREQPGAQRAFNGGALSGTSEESIEPVVRVSVGLVDAYA